MLTNKSILIIAITLVVGIAGIILLSLIFNRDIQTGVRFVVVPDEIAVTVKENNKKFTVNFNSVVQLKPGNYSLTLSRDEFETKSSNVEVKENSITNLYVYLEPLTGDARAIMASTVMKTRLERIGGYLVDQGGKELQEKYPFINSLPIVDKYFSINPCIQDDASVSICISLAIDNEFYKNQALNALERKEIDPKKWSVIFK